MKKVVKWYISGFYKKPKVGGTCALRRVATTMTPVALHATSLVTCCLSQGLKKPYNPIIGETFRCMWLHQKTNSKTFYIAEQVTTAPARLWKAIIRLLETHSSYCPLSSKFLHFMQVSHHPPVSALYVSNRKDGFCLSGSILAKSKFYGRSHTLTGRIKFKFHWSTGAIRCLILWAFSKFCMKNEYEVEHKKYFFSP